MTIVRNKIEVFNLLEIINLSCDHYHDYSCFVSMLERVEHQFLSSYKVYGMVHVFLLLAFRRKKLRSMPGHTLKQFFKGLAKSIAFLTTYGIWMKIFMCWGRNFTGGYFFPIHTTLVNTFAGCTSFMLEDKSRRPEITIVIFHRVLESFETFLRKREVKLAKSKMVLPFLFAFSFGVISDYYAKEKAFIKEGLKKLFSFLLGSDDDYFTSCKKDESISPAPEAAKSLEDKVE